MRYGKVEALVVGGGELKGRSVRCGAMDRAARLPSVWRRWDEEEERSPFSRFLGCESETRFLLCGL